MRFFFPQFLLIGAVLAVPMPTPNPATASNAAHELSARETELHAHAIVPLHVPDQPRSLPVGNSDGKNDDDDDDDDDGDDEDSDNTLTKRATSKKTTKAKKPKTSTLTKLKKTFDEFGDTAASYNNMKAKMKKKPGKSTSTSGQTGYTDDSQYTDDVGLDDTYTDDGTGDLMDEDLAALDGEYDDGSY